MTALVPATASAVMSARYLVVTVLQGHQNCCEHQWQCYCKQGVLCRWLTQRLSVLSQPAMSCPEQVAWPSPTAKLVVSIGSLHNSMLYHVRGLGDFEYRGMASSDTVSWQLQSIAV